MRDTLALKFNADGITIEGDGHDGEENLETVLTKLLEQSGTEEVRI